MSTTSSDLDDQDDIASARPRGPLARQMMVNYEEPRAAVYRALRTENTDGMMTSGIDNTLGTVERPPLSNFYMQRVPERERYYN